MFTENENGGDAPLSEEEAGKELQVPVFADPANPTPEEAIAAVEVAKSALAQKKHWRGKSTDPETGKPYAEVVPELRKSIKPPQAPAPSDALAKNVETLMQSEEKRSFGHRHQLSPEETDAAFAFAKGNGITPDKALEHAFVKSGIEAMRTASRNADNTPGASGRVPKVEGKTFGEMAVDDRRKNFPAIAAAFAKK